MQRLMDFLDAPGRFELMAVIAILSLIVVLVTIAIVGILGSRGKLTAQFRSNGDAAVKLSPEVTVDDGRRENEEPPPKTS